MSDCVVVEFSDPAEVLTGFVLLTELSEDGTLRVEDLAFTHSIDGVASTVAARRVDPAMEPLEHFATGTTDRAALDAVAQDLPHGRTAAIVRYDGPAMSRVLEVWRAAGAVITAGPSD